MANTQTDEFIPERVTLCSDGKYRWIYHFDMLKNPVILFTTWRVLLMSGFIVWLFVNLIGLIGGGFDSKAFVGSTKMILLLTLFLCGLGIIAYFIIAGQYGWKYIVVFEMDENGITHRQMKQQFDRAKAAGFLTILAGLASGNITTVASCINSATRDSLCTDFNKVKKMKVSRRQNTIFVNAPFSHNQVYVKEEDMDLVVDYIKGHLPKDAKIRGYL